MKLTLTFLAFLCIPLLCSLKTQGQPLNKKIRFSHADTLRGSDGEARDWWDVLKYNLHVSFNINDSSITGYNDISFKAVKKQNLLQLDLQAPMVLDSIYIASTATQKNIWATGKIKNIIKEGDAYFVDLSTIIEKPITTLRVFYHGKPRVAVNPPWDGGLIWKKDSNKNPWVSIACQGLGASVWYPCKDIQSDEPDSAELHITCPDSLVAVGNGRLRSTIKNNNGTVTYDWAVVNPINNYCLIPYIGKYAHFSELFKGEKGKLTMDYWVLNENLESAKKQFKDAPKMIKAFEYWFGPYPFYEDGYKLVDAPHLGMEHQSATAYGNGYKNGYYGRDLSGTGWGLKWDFIIVHESGHEWFANNITSKDIADMWVHEGFTCYSETLFTEFYYGKPAGSEYLIGLRKNIKNDIPIIGAYGVNKEGSVDMYNKAANMLHTIRQVINNDAVFRNILRGLNKSFYHQTVTTKQIENYISQQSTIDFSKVFDQYLRTTQVPTLEYKLNNDTLQYRYTTCINNFILPLKIKFKGARWINPSAEWKTLTMPAKGENSFSVDPNFYINIKKVD